MDALILGCTHYPLIRDEIGSIVGKKVELIDSTEIVGQEVRSYLKEFDLLRDSTTGKDHFFVSDLTIAFEKTAGLFFGAEVHLEERAV